MKKIILVSLLIATGMVSFSQTLPINVKTKGYYLNKSRHQRTISWALLGGGVALAAIGIGVAQSQSIDYSLGNSKSGNTGNVLTIAGVASALGSIPLFISAAHNKHRAAALAFNIQELPILYIAHNSRTFQPALTLKYFINNH
jgi:hypothetical protein